jgi:hypothetical protein
MVSDPYAQLADYRRKVAALEKQLAKSNRKLLQAPTKYGFKSMDAFIAALTAASGQTGATAKAKTAAATGRKARAKVTDETKAKVKEMVKAEKTGAEIARALDISLPTVQNIKKQLGLVQARKTAKKS